MASSSSPTETDIQNFNKKTVGLLAKGVMELYEPPLVTINTHLKELTERQETAHSMITSERRRLENLQNDATLDALLADIAMNKDKLTHISSTMMNVHRRVQALQVRASNVEKVAKQKVDQRPSNSRSNS